MSSRARSWSGLAPTPMAIFTALPDQAGCARPHCWPRSATAGRFPDAESLTSLAGAAPSTRQSGKHKKVVFRFACDKKRAAVMDFAGDSRHDNLGSPSLSAGPSPWPSPRPRRPHPGPGLAPRIYAAGRIHPL